MTRRARIADRLTTGSTLIARRLAARTAAWVARGRRTDLTGWRAALGCWTRLATLLLGLYLLWRLVRAVPNLLWLLTGCWTIASWRAGKPTDNTPGQSPHEATSTPDVEAVRRLLLDLMGTGSGVHLRTVLAHLQQHGQWQGRTVSDLRLHLERLDIPVHPKVKVAGTPTRGVRREDLQAPSPVSQTPASPSTSTGT